MKIQITTTLLVFVNLICLGNNSHEKFVNLENSLRFEISRLDSFNNLRIEKLEDSIQVLSKNLSTLNQRLVGFEEFKGEFRGSKESYKALFTVIGVIFLIFALLSTIIAYFSANRAFTINFGDYCKKIEVKEKESNVLLEKTKNHYNTVLKYSKDIHKKINRINTFKDGDNN